MGDPRVTDAFATYLRSHNLPVTEQRLAVADVVLSADEHLSAEEVENRLAGRGVSVGTATVYRTLDVLVKSGLVVERDFGEGFRRFESARGMPHHEHVSEDHGDLRRTRDVVQPRLCRDHRDDWRDGGNSEVSSTTR